MRTWFGEPTGSVIPLFIIRKLAVRSGFFGVIPWRTSPRLAYSPEEWPEELAPLAAGVRPAASMGDFCRNNNSADLGGGGRLGFKGAAVAETTLPAAAASFIGERRIVRGGGGGLVRPRNNT